MGVSGKIEPASDVLVFLVEGGLSSICFLGTAGIQFGLGSDVNTIWILFLGIFWLAQLAACVKAKHDKKVTDFKLNTVGFNNAIGLVFAAAFSLLAVIILFYSILRAAEVVTEGEHIVWVVYALLLMAYNVLLKSQAAMK